MVFRHEGPEAYLVAVSHALFGQMDMEPVTVAGGVLLGFIKVLFHHGLEGMPRGKGPGMTDNLKAVVKAAVLLRVDVFFIFAGIQDGVAVFKIAVPVSIVGMGQFQFNAHVKAGLAIFVLLTMESGVGLVSIRAQVGRLPIFIAVGTQIFVCFFIATGIVNMEDFPAFFASEVGFTVAAFTDIFTIFPADSVVIVHPFPAIGALRETFIQAVFAVEVIPDFFAIFNADNFAAMAAFHEVFVKAVFAVVFAVRRFTSFILVHPFSAFFAADTLVFQTIGAQEAQAIDIFQLVFRQPFPALFALVEAFQFRAFFAAETARIKRAINIDAIFFVFDDFAAMGAEQLVCHGNFSIFLFDFLASCCAARGLKQAGFKAFARRHNPDIWVYWIQYS